MEKSENGLSIAIEKLREGGLRAALKIEDELFVARHFRVARCTFDFRGRFYFACGCVHSQDWLCYVRGPSLCVMPGGVKKFPGSLTMLEIRACGAIRRFYWDESLDEQPARANAFTG